MTLGRTTAQAHRNALRKPTHLQARLGLRWATRRPSSASRGNSGSLTFTASSSGIGSSGHGSGIHTIF